MTPPDAVINGRIVGCYSTGPIPCRFRCDTSSIRAIGEGVRARRCLSLEFEPAVDRGFLDSLAANEKTAPKDHPVEIGKGFRARYVHLVQMV